VYQQIFPSSLTTDLSVWKLFATFNIVKICTHLVTFSQIDVDDYDDGKDDALILCFVDCASLYNLVNRTNFVHNVFLTVFIAFLYMFQATMCPSSGEITVPMQHLVFVTL
jgi:hypothetical protein